jgi:hypothetical protein
MSLMPARTKNREPRTPFEEKYLAEARRICLETDEKFRKHAYEGREIGRAANEGRTISSGR